MSKRNFEIDIERFRPVVFESDDWGTCENSASIEHRNKYREILNKYNVKDGSENCTLETSDMLEDVFKTLESYTGKDGIKPCFTAFTLMGNPDFEAMKKDNYSKYIDIALNDGFPSMWKRDGVLDKTLDGIKRGVWQAEYHGMLHHTSPLKYIELLNGNSKESEMARDLADIQVYFQLRHIPEYEGFRIKESFDMINTGISRFEKLFGYTPNAAVTSDATNDIEILWVARGVKTICLKNCRVNSGEIVVYPNKPWNLQDVYANMGDYNENLDATYLTRNCFMEVSQSLEEVIETIERNFKIFNESAIISTHRGVYCQYNKEKRAKNFIRLHKLLQYLNNNATFLTTGELGDIYRQGWSLRGNLLRKLSECEVPFLTGINSLTNKEEKINEKTLGSFYIDNKYRSNTERN